MKLSNVPSSQKPQDIINAYIHLKDVKEFGFDKLEEIVKKLYSEQKEISKLNDRLCDEFMDIHIMDQENKFAPFHAMSATYKVLNGKNKKYLEQMKRHLVHPLIEFNNFGAIKGARKLKIKLKRKKGEYDMCMNEKEKMEEQQRNGQKNVNVAHVQELGMKVKDKAGRLDALRHDFLNKMEEMDMEKVGLMEHFEQYMHSYAAYSQFVASGFKENHPEPKKKKEKKREPEIMTNAENGQNGSNIDKSHQCVNGNTQSPPKHQHNANDQITQNEQIEATCMSSPPQAGDVLIAISDYTEGEAAELCFLTGDKIILEEKDESGWWKGKLDRTGEVGWFAHSYVKPCNG